MVYAHVINGLVQDCSYWEREPDERELESYAPVILHDVTDLRIGPGWRWVEGQWLPPEEP